MPPRPASCVSGDWGFVDAIRISVSSKNRPSPRPCSCYIRFHSLISPIGNNDTNDDRLQHTDVDVPHFTDGDHNFVKGAFHTIDRPYDKLDPWGAIDFLHHKIGSTHVAHHFDSTIPHYKAQVATDAIKEAFPEIYLYDPTPIPEALWRVCKGCAAVEKRGEYYIWDNSDVKDELLKTE